MIHISMKRWAEGMELEAIGHANHGAIGRDIVCAGVSALLYSLAAYLEGQAAVCPTGHLDRTEAAGRLYLRTRHLEGEETAFAVTEAGLGLMQRAFPESVRFMPLTERKEETKEDENGRVIN